VLLEVGLKFLHRGSIDKMGYASKALLDELVWYGMVSYRIVSGDRAVIDRQQTWSNAGMTMFSYRSKAVIFDGGCMWS
jgi:hypothetical protein